MRFDFGSDLHLAFDAGNERILSAFPDKPSKTLVLAGDILEVAELKRKRGKHRDLFFSFLERCNALYEQVVYVFGNHEFYDAELNYAHKNASDIFQLNGLKRIHILENQTLDVGDALFFGATMWTSFRDANPIAMADAPGLMQDYTYIRYVDQYKERTRITPDMIYARHRMTVRALERFNNVATLKPKIVVTHHAPHCLSIPDFYRSQASSCLYYEELFDFIDSSDITVWVSGHTHNRSDYKINETRLLANPRGYYGYEEGADVWRFQTVEIGE